MEDQRRMRAEDVCATVMKGRVHKYVRKQIASSGTWELSLQ